MNQKHRHESFIAQCGNGCIYLQDDVDVVGVFKDAQISWHDFGVII